MKTHPHPLSLDVICMLFDGHSQILFLYYFVLSESPVVFSGFKGMRVFNTDSRLPNIRVSATNVMLKWLNTDLDTNYDNIW